MDKAYKMVQIANRLNKVSLMTILYRHEIDIESIVSYCEETMGMSGIPLYAFLIEQLNEFIKQDEKRMHELRILKHSQYLNTREWQIKRRIMILAYPKCQLCGKQEKYYHVHHNNYSNLPIEAFTDLTVLCEYCHEQHHRDENLIKQYAKNIASRMETHEKE